jgi:CheY-like chemotaxis protein
MPSYRVLVVDDHPDTAEVLSVLFQMLGHAPRCALRGRDVLQLVRELDPHLILLDIGLPDITGYEVVRALRADPRNPEPRNPGRYIAAVTGHCRPADVSRATSVGFNQHISKPVDLGKVRDVLRRVDSHYARTIAAPLVAAPAGAAS